MRIVDRDAFLALRAGTLYAKVGRGEGGEVFYGSGDALAIKGESVSTSFYYQELVPWPEGANDTGEWIDAWDRMLAGRSERPDFHCEGKDGPLDADQIFLVLEAEDVTRLIARLHEALADGYEKAQADGERQPGWYWVIVNYEGSWEPARWDGSLWYRSEADFAEATIIRDKDVTKRGPRIPEPDEKGEG